MAKLSWNSYGENVYEHGVDRVVAYPEGGAGLAWSGVSSISEKNDTTVDGYYLDGLKYVQVPSYGEYGASLEAYAIPSDLNLCLGFAQLSPGLFATNQRRRSFDLSYRTLVGNEDSDRIAYKLHLVYNAVATPSFGGGATIKDTPEPSTYSLELSTMPPEGSVPNLRPTAHLILDSRYVPSDVMEDIERILYGTDILEPRLPSPNEILMLTQAPAYTVSWDGAPDASASRLVRRTSEVVAKNLATNPSFEATSGTVEVRRNLAWDPLATAVGTVSGQARWAPRWYGTGGGAGTTTAVSGASDGPLPGVSTYLRKTWTAAGGISDTGFDHTIPSATSTTALTTGLPVAAGRTYTFSSWIRASRRPGTANVDLRVVWRDAAGERILPAPTRALSAVMPGVWQRVSITLTAPANATTASIATDIEGSGATWQPGDTLDGTALLIEESPVLGDFFAPGLTSPDSDLTPAWTGTANASASVLTGVGVVGTVSTTSLGVGYVSTVWAESGTKSIRVTPKSSSSDTFVDIRGMVDIAALRGKTVTVAAKVRLASAQSGTLLNRAREFVGVLNLEGGGQHVLVWNYSKKAPNEPGVHEVRATTVFPANAASFSFLRLYNGASAGNGDVWWDDLAIIEGNYTGPWFDGSNLPD